MDELKTIREALQAFDDENYHNGNDCTKSTAALEALSRLEAREAEAPKDTRELADLFVETLLMLQRGFDTGKYELWLIARFEKLTGRKFVEARTEIAKTPEVLRRQAEAVEP